MLVSLLWLVVVPLLQHLLFSLFCGLRLSLWLFEIEVLHAPWQISCSFIPSEETVRVPVVSSEELALVISLGHRFDLLPSAGVSILRWDFLAFCWFYADYYSISVGGCVTPFRFDFAAASIHLVQLYGETLYCSHLSCPVPRFWVLSIWRTNFKHEVAWIELNCWCPPAVAAIPAFDRTTTTSIGSRMIQSRHACYVLRLPVNLQRNFLRCRV
jgi:hypothetical protein